MILAVATEVALLSSYSSNRSCSYNNDYTLVDIVFLIVVAEVVLAAVVIVS